MRVFLYEFVTGGGWWSVDDRPPGGSLLREGAAMLSALAGDFAEFHDVWLLRDIRLAAPEGGPENVVLVGSAAEERRKFADLAAAADATVVIAPEFDRQLLTRSQWAEQLGAGLLSPDSRFVALAADKQETAERLAACGVRVPNGYPVSPGLDPPSNFPFPGVVKPRDGAGSVGVRKVADVAEMRQALNAGRECRLEEFQSGMPASVSVMAGPAGSLVLPACEQSLSDDGRFQYRGGRAPLAARFCRRAERLARAVKAALPATTGFFGIDLVLGDCESGTRDVVIEVNPRLTTSYLGLRRIARGNLAEAMYRIARGERVELSFACEPVQFGT